MDLPNTKTGQLQRDIIRDKMIKQAETEEAGEKLT